MNEDRLLIMKMLEEGKITAQEAVELLEALEASAQPKQNKTDDVWRRIEKQGEDLTQKIEKAVERFSQSLEMTVEEHLPRVLSKIPFLNNIAIDVHEFTQEYHGSFAADLTEIPISLSNINGSIMVEGWEQEGYKLVVKQRIKAKDRETALGRLIQLDIPQDGAVVDRFNIYVNEQKDVTLSFQLFIPRKGPYQLTLKSTNGSSNVVNLIAKTIQINTMNGSVMIKQCRADSLVTDTGNGSNTLDYVEAHYIDQKTINGSIKFAGSGAQVSCKSTNGSIKMLPLVFAHDYSKIEIATLNGGVRCILPQLPNLNVRVDAVSSVGRINVGIPNFMVQNEQRSGGRHSLRGEVRYEGEQGKTVDLSVHVNCGSISINTERDSTK